MNWSTSGRPVTEQLKISAACPLILPTHIALDQARERASGRHAIGTTGRGIGPAYEDKAARRSLRVSDLFDAAAFGERLAAAMDLHNFMLQSYYEAAAGGCRRDPRRMDANGRNELSR